ncbi:ABC transporter substrate-binding protein [Streptomyces sp. SPB074]|uniref:ABC transporter substrate-binding protein n=1 Tax=Streptomyces sp. (strain SPB074) TaxID=465543 RepID=UPI00017F0EA3|nr:ABC transporter substrate-binding protein [Streptomyces sp. SPB074]EDY44663.1 oligopeptide binding protein [Streptomyces sp. SPB074]
MNRKTWVLSSVIGLLVPVLAGCGGLTGSDDKDKPIVVGTSDIFTAGKKMPAPFDPAYAYDISSWNLLRQTIQSLMRIPRGGGEPAPEAAQECSFTDSGQQRFTCTLRPGLRFANGHAITSKTFKYSIERVVAINADSGVSGLLNNIDTIQTPTPRDIVFLLKSPDATFPYKLSTPTAGAVDPALYPRKRLRDGFVLDGSGPYSLKPETKGGLLARAVLSRNPTYKGGLRIQNDKVELRPFKDPDRLAAALEKGEIDVIAKGLTTGQTSKWTARPPAHVGLTEMPALEIRYLAFDTKGVSKPIRQAIAHLVDRGQIASEVYGTAAEPLYSLVPQGVASHSNSFFNLYGEPSVAKAREVLEEAGITTPVPLTLHYTTDHYGTRTKGEFEVLKKQLNASGLFRAEIKGAPWDVHRPDGIEGKYKVYGMGWFPDFPDPDSFIAPFLGKPNFLNSPYDNKRIRTELLPESRRAADRLSTANGSLQKIQDIVAEEVPFLPLWQGKQYIAARDDITGVEWALSSSSILQLWELDRGVGS